MSSSKRRRFGAFRDIFSRSPKTREQLASLISDWAVRGFIGQDEVQVLQGALKVPEMLVREVMVPRSQMVVISLSETQDEFLPKIIRSKHSRFPVVGDTLDDLRGLLLAKDLLPILSKDSRIETLADTLREVPIVPESKRLNALLDEFRDSRCHMAVVVDEYGSTSGLVTIEDVLEQIVGEIEDEHDQQEQEVQELEDGSLMVEAGINLDDLNTRVQVDIGEDGEFETLGGLLLARFGRVPDTGERMSIGNYEYEIQQATARRIKTVRIYPPAL